MKLISFILALYVLLLSAAPTILEDKCLQEQSTEQEQNEQDCSDCCSPFIGCSTCCGFTFPTSTFEIKFVILHPNKNILYYKEYFNSDFHSSIWQPPKGC